LLWPLLSETAIAHPFMARTSVYSLSFVILYYLFLLFCHSDFPTYWFDKIAEFQWRKTTKRWLTSQHCNSRWQYRGKSQLISWTWNSEWSPLHIQILSLRSIHPPLHWILQTLLFG
jgi:hypothetical protein